MTFEEILIKLNEGYWCFRKSKPNIHFILLDDGIIDGFDIEKDFLHGYNGGENLTNLDKEANDWDIINH